MAEKNSHIETTLVLIKPDAVERGLVGQVMTRFENAGLRIVGMKFLQASPEDMRRHYGDWVERYSPKLGAERANAAYQAIVGFMTGGPLVALVLEGVQAVMVVRKLVGATYPNEALPGTIRGDFAHVSQDYGNEMGLSVKNLIHASGNAEEAKAEIAAWFSNNELFEYEPAHFKHTRH